MPSDVMDDSSKTRLENIYRLEAGPNLKADECTTPKQVFDHFIDSRILDFIVGFTNRHIVITRCHYNCEVNYVYYTDRDDLLVFIGLCLLGGVHKAGGENVSELWNVVDGKDIFRTKVSLRIFQFLIENLRFDDRDHRRKSDKLVSR